jgi:hypothetical protein
MMTFWQPGNLCAWVYREILQAWLPKITFPRPCSRVSIYACSKQMSLEKRHLSMHFPKATLIKRL